MIEIFQAEWCPYSAAVREALTELGIDFVARQGAPSQHERAAMRAETGTSTIPVLVLDDGRILAGADAILPYLATLPAGPGARGHRDRYAEHRDARARELTGQLLERHVPR